VVTVFLLQHALEDQDGNESAKLLGVYSSEQNAQTAIEHYRILPGFIDYPDGFCVSSSEVDKSDWNEGFVT
jgi:hypothetical protein